MSISQDYPRRLDGTLDLARIAAQLSLSMHPIGSALAECASRLAYMRDLMPPRGDLAEEFRELVKTLAWIERAYRDADQTIIDAAFTIDTEQSCSDAA